MKTIKIAFSGMDGDFNPKNNFIVNVLKKKYKVVLSKNPDFLFYSQNSKDYLNYKCVRIFFTAENLVPDFNLCDYAIAFNYMDFGDRYFRFPLYLVDGFNAYKNDDYANDLKRALQKHENPEKTLKEKTEFCSFVYSNGQAAKCREVMFDKLSKYKTVNSGGRYINNVGGPVDNKLDFQLKHKFSIAFENTSTPGYTTEKIVHSFSAKTIPIYWGDPEIARVFNPKAFINCHDYGLDANGDNTAAFEKIIDRVKEIDQNDELYLSILSEPTFREDYNVSEQQKSFEKFLFNIVSQNPQNAYRRNRFYWGERYERKQKIGNTFYWQLRKLIPLRDALKKFFRN